MGGQGDTPYCGDRPRLFLCDGAERPSQGCHGQAKYAGAQRHIAGTGDLEFRVQPHVSNQGKQDVLEMESGRGKVLKQASVQFDRDSRSGKGQDRQDAERQHGRRAGRADVPTIVASRLQRTGMKHKLLRTLGETFRTSVHQLGNGFDDAEVLRTQSRFISFGPGIDHMDGPPSQRGERHALPHDRAAAGIAGTIDGKDCSVGPSQGHERVMPIPCAAGTTTSRVYLLQDQCNALSAVASCLTELHLPVDAYPNRLPDPRGPFFASPSINHGNPSMICR